MFFVRSSRVGNCQKRRIRFSRRNDSNTRRSRIEPLEDRSLLSAYELAQTIIDPPGFEDEFGFSVAADNSLIAIGAPQTNTSVSDTGAVYLYGAYSDAPIVLENPENDAVDWFGYSVGLAANLVAIGVPLHDDIALFAGSVRTFNLANQTWNEFNPPDPVEDGRFGNSVAISESVLIVTALETDGDLDNNGINDQTGAENGVIYALNRLTGAVINKTVIASPDDIDVYGNWVIIGDGEYDAPGMSNAGRAYLWNWSTGTTIIISNPGLAPSHDEFGTSVAIHENKFIIGAPKESSNGFNVGRAYIYTFNTSTGAISGSPITVADPDPGGQEDLFGSSVDISADRVVVGAPGDKIFDPTRPRARTFDLSGNPEQELLATEFGASANDTMFGNAVAISPSSGAIIVGAFAYSGEGAAVIFSEDKTITVNVVSDAPDLTPIGDGVVDVNLGLSGNQVSLRGAVQEANADSATLRL